MASWVNGPMLGFDTETTGVDPSTDRILTAALVHQDADGNRKVRTWLINPGVDIPASSTEIHGITNEQVQADGVDPAQALEEDRKSTRLNSSHVAISYAGFCLQ